MKVVKFIFKILILLALLCVLIFLYSKYMNAKGFIIKEKTLYSKELPKDFDGLKIVQISDINYGTSINKKELKDIVKKINLTKPDILVLTGDLLNSEVDYSSKDIEFITNELKKIETSIDKYAIAGNHDCHFQDWDNIINNSDFINLNDTYKIIYKNDSQILVGGLSTTSNDKSTSSKIKETIKYLDEHNIYSVLALHEPDTVKNIDYDSFNLILAGHSLGGQFRLPIIGGLIRKKGSKRYVNPYYKINDTKLFVSNGLGNDKIKYRFLNKPSFSLFRLRHKNS